MATFTLATPLRVGDLTDGITIDKLDLVSISINFQGTSAIISVILRHSASGHTHTVTLRNAEADTKWTAIKAAYPNFEKQILALLADKLPGGVVT